MEQSLTNSSNHDEVILPEDAFIVSKTDSESCMTYVNQSFCEVSGYSENELIGQSHDMVRNDLMPHGIYNLMWEHLKAEEEFFGYIVNRNKDNSHYWALINVSPCYEKNTLTGYFSVRRAPSNQALAIIKPLYQSMRQAEKSASPEQRLPMSSAVLWQAITKEYQSYAEFVLSL
ncbi:MAG: PAS domain S-box protein [Oleispira sp.]|nr:PAS domain S-box protein [Oleispira sp.]